MAKNDFGPFGFYRGKIGRLSFYVRNGKQVVRERGKMSKAPTLGQLDSRKQLAVTVAFLKPVLEFVRVGFLLVAKGTAKTPYNMATAYNRLNAVTGDYPDVVIDYSKVRVTSGKGRAMEAIKPAAELVAGGLKFSWQAAEQQDWERNRDQVMLLAYFPNLKSAVYVLYGAERWKLSDVLPLNEALLAEYMEVYISFIAADRKGIADSEYLGRFG